MRGEVVQAADVPIELPDVDPVLVTVVFHDEPVSPVEHVAAPEEHTLLAVDVHVQFRLGQATGDEGQPNQGFRA